MYFGSPDSSIRTLPVYHNNGKTIVMTKSVGVKYSAGIYKKCTMQLHQCCNVPK